MKALLRIFIFLIISYNLFLANIFAQSNSSKLANTNKSEIIFDDSSQVINSDDSLTWSHSLYLSCGYGTPQGFRFELGYNFGFGISLAPTFGIKDHWSRDPEEGTLGIILKMHLSKSKLTIPYLLVGTGGTIAIFGGSDTYVLIQIGSKISLNNWLQLCPEFGFVFTSKYISGGRSLFGSSPEVNDNNTRLGFNISFEIDFRQIF
jgi:hypothetical protein